MKIKITGWGAAFLAVGAVACVSIASYYFSLIQSKDHAHQVDVLKMQVQLASKENEKQALIAIAKVWGIR